MSLQLVDRASFLYFCSKKGNSPVTVHFFLFPLDLPHNDSDCMSAFVHSGAGGSLPILPYICVVASLLSFLHFLHVTRFCVHHRDPVVVLSAGIARLLASLSEHSFALTSFGQ